MTRRHILTASERDRVFRALETDLRADLPGALALNGMGGFLWDLTAGLLFADPGALAVFGLEPAEFDGRVATLVERILPEELPRLRQQTADAHSEATDYAAYFRVRPPGGDVRWVHSQAVMHRDDAGRALRAVGIIRDATAELQQAADQAVLESDRKNRSEVVHATTSALSRALTVDDVLKVLTGEEILGPVGAAAMSLTVLEQGRLRRLTNTGMPAGLLHDLDVIRPEDPLPVAEVFRTRKPLFIDRQDVRDRYAMLWPYIRGTEFTATAVLPLIAQARLTGVLAILYADKRQFGPEERNLLLALAATVAQSVQRALLYEEEHAMAVGLQQSMLPARIPDVPGVRVAVRYQPARTGRQIGGDWYDVVPLPAGRVGLVVGDVQGHDVQASAVMGQLRTALRAYAVEGHTPEAIMAKASLFLHELDTERLATCVYVDLDPVTGTALIVRAGHPVPLIRHLDGAVSWPEVTGGLPLGLPEYREGPYPVTALQLASDDVFMLCTDGLLEFRGMDLEAGELEIEAILRDGSPADLDLLARHIVAAIETRQRQEDDVALLLAALTRA